MTTKQNEIDTLREFAAKQAHGSYLSMLFTRDMLDWCETQIRSDFPPDVYDRLLATGKANGEIHLRLDETARSLRRAEERAADLAATVEALRKELGEARQLLADMNTKRNELSYALQDAQLGAEFEEQRLRAEIDRLKVKLFDLMDKGEN